MKTKTWRKEAVEKIKTLLKSRKMTTQELAVLADIPPEVVARSLLMRAKKKGQSRTESGARSDLISQTLYTRAGKGKDGIGREVTIVNGKKTVYWFLIEPD